MADDNRGRGSDPMTGDARELKLTEFRPDWTLRPGIALAEVLADRHLTPGDAAAVTGLPVDTITGIGTGTTIIDEPTAEALHAGLGVSAQFWLDYQANHTADLARGAKDVSRDYERNYPWIAGDGRL
jgi:plasmid maintenance system antidote protein VapI